MHPLVYQGISSISRNALISGCHPATPKKPDANAFRLMEYRLIECLYRRKFQSTHGCPSCPFEHLVQLFTRQKQCGGTAMRAMMGVLIATALLQQC